MTTTETAGDKVLCIRTTLDNKRGIEAVKEMNHQDFRIHSETLITPKYYEYVIFVSRSKAEQVCAAIRMFGFSVSEKR
ncbi:hypothetical protein JXD20_03540 [Candidatus Peregrinibacteria bacterium]|nr:hypothetical protein [Candidatus Peregrinibacteria bacterium]